MGITGYLKADLKRSICSIRFFLSVVGISFLMWIASYETIQWRHNVVLSSYFIMMSTPFLVAYMIAAIPYSGSICEDLEYKYCYLQLIRGKTKAYVFSKAVVIFLSACLTMAAGIWIFLFVLHGFLPWFSKEDDIYLTLLAEGSFRYLLQKQYFVLYYFCIGIQKGLFAGLLALMASMGSLIYANRLFVLTIPGMMWYLLDTIGLKVHLPDFFRLPYIFSADNNLGNHEMTALFSMAAAAFIGFCCLEKMMEILLDRRIRK